MKKNHIVLIVWILLVSTNVLGQSQQKRSNILWIVANDLCPDLASYGNKQVHTPNLDEFAGQGVLYKNLISVGAVRSPNRSSFITGRYSVRFTCQNQFPSNKTTLLAGIVSVTDLFNKGGYYTTNASCMKTTGSLSKDMVFCSRREGNI